MPAVKIIFGDLPSPLGEMIAGATDTGLCFLEWQDRGGVERIKNRVTKRYGLPLLPGTNEILRKSREELAAYFAGELKKFTVPLDLAGTQFERQVWTQLRKIPYGQTKSYGEIARALGKPGASRAVGRANGANYISIIIPCHRVIEAGGGLRGYGGGLHRKKYLLDLETGVKSFV